LFNDVDADNDRYRDPQDEDEPTWDEFDLGAESGDEPPQRRRGITTVLIFAMLLLTALPIANSRASTFGDWFWSHVPGEPSAQPSGLTWCPGVSSVDKKRIDLGAEQMRRTTESETLLENLVDRHICVGVEDLVYNGGYTLTSDDASGEEVRRVVLASAVVRSLSADELAATMVHEAEHAARVYAGTNCGEISTCTFLKNGVAVEEEEAAHAAEARFWIAIHGSKGKQSSIPFSGAAGTDYLNDLIAAYQDGPDAFRAYVIEIRSDPREGQDIPTQ